MVLAIIEPKSPDIYGEVFTLDMYTSPYLVTNETDTHVTIRIHNRLATFHKSFILKSI